jgi:hypothetical protein
MSLTPYVLDFAVNSGIDFAAGPYKFGQLYTYDSIKFPLTNHIVPAKAAELPYYIETNVDLKAPGVRDLVPNPTFPYLGPFRSHIFDRQQHANNAPMPNYEQMPSFLSGPVNQRRNAEIFTLLQDCIIAYRPEYQERGQWSNPHTGFSALRDIKPVSTMKFI